MIFKFQKSENIEDLGQKFEDFNGQNEEDVQQQLVNLNMEADDLGQHQVDMNVEAEDLRQKQVGISHGDRLLDNYAQRDSNHREYQSHYHGEKESAEEYEAEVC